MEEHEQQEITAPHAERRSRRTRDAIIMVSALAGFVLAAVWHMVYNAPNIENKLRTQLVVQFPFPVASVNGDWVLLRDFENNIASATFFLSQQAGQFSAGQLPTKEELRQNELDRLVNFRIKQQLGSERGITVTQDDIEKYFQEQILPQAPGGIDEVEQTLSALYAWSLDDFKKNILEEVVLDQKLQESFQNDEAAVNEVRDRAQKLHDEIVNSEKSFSDFAKENSEDTGTALDGGMLGYFGRGAMVPEFEQAAFALDVGQVSDIVKTQYGYHIIKVTNKDAATDRVEARHILFVFKTPNDIVNEQRDTITVRTFLPRYHDADTPVASASPAPQPEASTIPPAPAVNTETSANTEAEAPTTSPNDNTNAQ